MTETFIRQAISTDIPVLMQMNHTMPTQYVWQMDYADDVDAYQIKAAFRRIRLPREIWTKYPRNVRWLADTWNRNALTLVAARQEQLLGYVRMEARHDVAWITDLVVDLPVREQGVGMLLLQEVFSRAQTENFRQVILEMISKNYPASALARKAGMEFCGYNDQYYATHDVAIFFGQTLK